jgi:phthalate 4,5-cis-dihydrodiol dehydrogenase
MTVRFGICGLGLAGAVLMAPDLRARPDVTIAGACDPNPDVRAKFGRDFDVPVFATQSEMIDAVGPDVLYICSPHQFHAEHVIEAARRGVHVIVEKPMTINLSDARTMVDTVEHAGIQLVVGHSRGADPVVGTMRNIIRRGEVGRIAMMNCWNFTDFLYRPRRPEELDTRLGGGIIYNQLSHVIDAIKTVTDKKVLAVRASAGVLDPERPTEGHCVAFLTMSDGVVATFVYSGYDHFDSDEFQFWIGELGNPRQASHAKSRRLLKSSKAAGISEGELRVQRYGYGGPIAQGLQQGWSHRRQAHFGTMVATCEHADLRPSPDGVLVYANDGVQEVPAELTRQPYRLNDPTIDEMLNAIAGRAPVLRDARWGMDTLRVCNAVLESSASGVQVDL